MKSMVSGKLMVRDEIESALEYGDEPQILAAVVPLNLRTELGHTGAKGGGVEQDSIAGVGKARVNHDGSSSDATTPPPSAWSTDTEGIPKRASSLRKSFW
jgi:hypothetical protein